MEATPPNPYPVTAVDPPPQTLRLMCSYGGHIVPRPHDKTLSYIGGDTRIVLVDRHVSVGDLHARLSKTLHQNYPFLLKYQIPNEDLDSLISVSTDEDFQNMVEEYDRLANKRGRLRLFMFPKMVQSIDLGQVFGNKGSSEEWFLGILNGTAKSLPSGFTDSVNCLLGLELDEAEKCGDFASEGAFLEGHLVENERKVVNSGGIANQDVPDSPIIQANSSSFGSTSSLKSVRMGAVGVEEQLHQMSGVGNAINNVIVADHNQQISRDDAVVVGNCVNSGAVSDDDMSDHSRKAQEVVLQIQHQTTAQQVHQRQGGVGVLDLPSPDSASSEGSITNPLSRQRQTVHQEPSISQIQSANNHITTNQSDSKIEVQTPIQESSYLLSGLYNPHYHHHQNPHLHHQQRFVHAGTQYIPVTSYYPVYPHQNHPNQPVLDQPYPVYFIQARPSQAYNLPMQQQNYSDLASNAQKTPASSVAAYNHQVFNVPSSKPDAVTLASTAPPQLVQVPSAQHQTQYVGYAQTMHHPSQSIAQPSSSTSKGSVYGYELSDPEHAQIHYSQPLPPQYQASSSAMADSSSSSQINADSIKLKNRAVQP